VDGSPADPGSSADGHRPSDRFGDLGRILVVVPTYNERDNLESIVARLRRDVPEASVLIVDDNSPDGTGRIADRLADADPQIQVLHRQDKQGLGAAYLAGFTWGLDAGFDVLVEMDADGSHDPVSLPVMLDRLRAADLVLGSRYVPGGRVVDWPRRRELLSRGGNLYTKLLLGLPVVDATGGYRAFRASALRAIDLGDVGSAGYVFQVDLTRRVAAAGLRLAEVPITFRERQLGASKMSTGIVVEALWQVTRRGVESRFTRLTGRPARRPTVARVSRSAG